MAVTIKDVARMAGVSMSTVSKYMNGKSIRDGSRAKIEKAVQRLHYFPNGFARGLRTSRTYSVGVLTDSLRNQYIAKMVYSIEKYLKKAGYSMILCCHQDQPSTIRELVRFLCEKQVDGIIVESIYSRESIYEKEIWQPTVRQHIPIVCMDRPQEENGAFDCVMSNGASGTYQGVEYLVRHGHKNIAFLSGTNYNSGLIAAKDRLRGYTRVMEDYGLPVRPGYVLKGDFSFDSGYRAMRQFVNLSPRPTALFISNYNMCLGAMRALHEFGIQIPEELSVVTFDDLEFSVICRPKLTAVRQPVEDISEEAVALLLRRIQGDYADFPRLVKLPTALIARDSVKDLNRDEKYKGVVFYEGYKTTMV